MRLGRFITLEGGEGAGKSTQIAKLAEALRAAGVAVVVTREPGGSPRAEEIRALLVRGATDRWQPMTEALLHNAARVEHVEELVRPALARGEWVLCDRFADSTVAYQGFGHGLGRESIEDLHALVFGAFLPDLTLVLDLDVEQGLARATAAARGEDRYERMGRDFHERLRRGYLDIAKRNPARCVVVDASLDAETVAAALRRAINERLGMNLP